MRGVLELKMRGPRLAVGEACSQRRSQLPFGPDITAAGGHRESNAPGTTRRSPDQPADEASSSRFSRRHSILRATSQAMGTAPMKLSAAAP